MREKDTERLLRLAADAGIQGRIAVAPLAAAASSRRYYRLTATTGDNTPASTYIGAIGESEAENRAFVMIARSFENNGVAAPRVVAAEPDCGAYIVTDLGDTTLMDLIDEAKRSGDWEGSKALAALVKCVEALPRLQYRGAAGTDPAYFYPRPAMDRRAVMWDLNHFKYCFLKAAGAEMDEEGLENDFETLASMIESGTDDRFKAFIHRDCQSRNVMIDREGNPAWIDFQGGRIGPVAYDVVSLVWHVRAGIPDAIRHRLLEVYVEALSDETGMVVGVDRFMEQLRPVLVLRLLQVLGAYGLRGITEGKAAFITPMASVARELGKLKGWMLQSGMPALASVVGSLGVLRPVAQSGESRDELIVTVMSFSYKRGLPRDYSGNGGGFVFDCRYPNNPGRYAEYRSLTGRDEAVIDFLERDGEMPRLARQAVEMVIPAVERYAARGFTHLQVAFGCTGGRHRSVYGAEFMAGELRKRGVKVLLIHREQGITELA